MNKLSIHNYLIKILLYWLTVFSCTTHACGWWGDGEMNWDSGRITRTHEGKRVPETLSLQTSKLPGRLGHGIAVLEPGEAVPYLQATYGRLITRIDELKSFGFVTVIDLGTSSETAQSHRAETEAVGMRYISIPINGDMPNQDQVQLFRRSIIDFASEPLLVYAPRSYLLGVMWALYRLDLGAPLGYILTEGRELGMLPTQEAELLRRTQQIHEQKPTSIH